MLVALLLVVTFSRPAAAQGPDEISLPPGDTPVEVHVGFYLLDLLELDERSETFSADAYLSFRWRDARLAFTGTETKHFLEDKALDQLETMWWPQVEFVNTSAPNITNRRLEIHPDGDAEYVVGISANFRADLDLHRFPFDVQKLDIWVESFLWTEQDLRFVVDDELTGKSDKSTLEGIEITGVNPSIDSRDLQGWGGEFSRFVGRVEIERKGGFYLWTVFIPVVLIFLISCTAFILPVESFNDRVSINLTALLACIATQFAMSFNLPQISYLTVIDWMFVTVYLCIALCVLTSTLQAMFLQERPAIARRIDRWAGLAFPVLFLVLIGSAVLLT